MEGPSYAQRDITNPLIYFTLEHDYDDAEAAKFHWDCKVEPVVVMNYIAYVSDWMQLCSLEDAGDGFSGVDYWTKPIFPLDALQEFIALRTLSTGETSSISGNQLFVGLFVGKVPNY